MEGARRFSLLPRSSVGWWSVALSAVAIAWVIVGRTIQQALKRRACPGGLLCTDGRHYVALALVLGLTASVLGLVALISRRDRAFLVWLTVVPAALLTAFWLLFAAGEVVAPH